MKEIATVNNLDIDSKLIDSLIAQAIIDHDALNWYAHYEQQLEEQVSLIRWYFIMIQDHICGLGDFITQLGFLRSNNHACIVQVKTIGESHLGGYI